MEGWSIGVLEYWVEKELSAEGGFIPRPPLASVGHFGYDFHEI